MVTKGIVLGHKISRKGIEVDKAKVDVIEKLPPLANMKGYGIRILLLILLIIVYLLLGFKRETYICICDFC